MLASSFADAYPRTLSNSQIYDAQYGVDLSDSRQWSARFGDIAFNALEGNPLPNTMNIIDSYCDWFETDFGNLASSLQDIDEKNANKVANEITFHNLNFNMAMFWNVVSHGNAIWKNPSARRTFISNVQDNVALSGVRYYAVRDKILKGKDGVDYYSKTRADERGSLEGQAAEFDAAVVLLEAMRRSNDLVVVPAPIQFEKFSKRSISGKSANSDFLVMRGQNVAGIQVKSRIISRQNIEKYDESRVVMLDASHDMGNVRAVRTEKLSSNKRLVTWGGLICAQRVLDIKTVDKREWPLMLSTQDVLRTKFAARSMVGNSKSYLSTATQHVSCRIEHALSE